MTGTIGAATLAPGDGDAILARIKHWAPARPCLHWIRLDSRARGVVLNFAKADDFAARASRYVERLIAIGSRTSDNECSLAKTYVRSSDVMADRVVRACTD
ncbi:MAG: hypothetical protein JWP08_379 [Bryobacterales bacterium]|nr:hypothetical protein [Bryobacterales bacterium]